MSLVRIGGPPPLPSYLMDLALSEEFSFPGEATKFPVEKGVDFTDHIRELPDEVTLECIVSDTPIGDVATDPTRQPATGPDGTTSTALPSAEALQRLRELKAARRPVRIETTLGTFTSMAFIDLNVPVSKDKSPGRSDPDPKKQRPGALFFTAKFRKVVVTTNTRTKVRVRTSMAGAGGQPKAKAVIGKAAVADAVVEWKHDIAKGRFIGIVSQVEVRYNRPPGLSKDEAIVLGKKDPAMPWTEYTDLTTGEKVTGQRRTELTDDLREQARQARVGAPIPTSEVNNLPAGLNLNRFQQTAPDTFDNSLSSEDLQRFQRNFPPTFPGQ